MEKIAMHLDFTKRHDACATWISFAYQFGGNELKNLLKEITEKNNEAKKFLVSLEEKLSKIEEERNSLNSFRAPWNHYRENEVEMEDGMEDDLEPAYNGVAQDYENY
jgi:DNA repair exonuclease SbcCD ATPase subunit